jgi:hypothetical protein
LIFFICSLPSIDFLLPTVPEAGTTYSPIFFKAVLADLID